MFIESSSVCGVATNESTISGGSEVEVLLKTLCLFLGLLVVTVTYYLTVQAGCWINTQQCCFREQEECELWVITEESSDTGCD